MTDTIYRVLAIAGICAFMVPVGILTLAYVLERLVTRRLHVERPVEKLVIRLELFLESE